MASASDVPTKFDVVIDGTGFRFLAADQSANYGFRHPSAQYSYTPTFIERTNTSGAFGDNQQDFYLTVSQNNWDLGEGQRYFRSQDTDRVRRFWAGTNVDPVSTPGQVTIRNTVGSLSFAATVRAMCDTSAGVYTASSTNLYLVNASGSIVDKGAHGLGVAPSKWGMASDSSNVFLASTSGGTAGVRKWDGSSYTTFSATGSDSLTFLNNTLYGFRESNGDLVSYSTAGAITSLFVWKDAAGNALTGSSYATRIRPYGGKVMLLRTGGFHGGELWTYDGTGVSKVADFPANFVATDLEIVSGIAFVAGYVNRNADVLPAIFYYVNGTTGQLWRSGTAGYTNLTGPSMSAYSEGLAFTDDSTGRILQYNLSTGGVHTLGSYTVTNATPMLDGNQSILVHTRNSATGYYFPTTTVASTATVITSLMDFENSLTKLFRGVRLDFDTPTGSSVDIAYQTDSVDGSWTTLQSGATSGTEYVLTGVSGRSIAIKVTLNKGSSASGPSLKRIYVRAAPLQTTFRKADYLLNCFGRDGSAQVELRDGSLDPDDGMTKVTALRASLAKTTPITITDRFGTFTGIVEPSQTDISEIRPEEFIVTCGVREV